MGQGQCRQSDRLIIFGRYPIPGKTKTRLIPALGKAGAAELQREITEKVVCTAAAFALESGAGIEFCFDGGDEKKMKQWLGKEILYTNQGSGDLGSRMERAFLRAFDSGCRRAVLFGSDIPGLTKDHLSKAFGALEENDLVLGPSLDGGYYLVGMKTPAKIFQNIAWGTSGVLEKTLSMARNLRMSVYELSAQRDIDTEEDLNASLPGWKTPYISVIIPALNEASRIELSIDSARSMEAEVIVVDGGSTDDTLEKASRKGVRVLAAQRGRALQQNAGASLARGKVLLFLHADTKLPSDYASSVFETLMDPRTALGAFRFKTDLGGGLIRLTEFLTNLRSRYLKLPYGDQAFFLRRVVFDAVDGFPEVPIAEDLLFLRKVSRHGRIAIVAREALTSGRRWKAAGIIRTSLINQMVVSGLALGISPSALASLYWRFGVKRP